MCNNITIIAIPIIVYAQTLFLFISKSYHVYSHRIMERAVNFKFPIILDLHVIQHHAIKCNTIIYIAFIEIPRTLMTFYVMAKYEFVTDITNININTCCHQ